MVPYVEEVTPVKIPSNRLIHVEINDLDEITVGASIFNHQLPYELLTNRFRSESPPLAVRLSADRLATYDTYIQVRDAMQRAIVERLKYHQKMSVRDLAMIPFAEDTPFRQPDTDFTGKALDTIYPALEWYPR